MRKHLHLFFAKRYLFSAKSHSVINIIAGMSAFTVAIPVAALVILLSVYNGLDDILKAMYGKFDAPLQITAVEGKTFASAAVDADQLLAIRGVEAVTQVLEENTIFVYGKKQHIGTLRGVDSMYRVVTPVDSMVVRGSFDIKHGDLNQAVVGMGVAYTLGIGLNLAEPLDLYVPRRGQHGSLLPMANFNSDYLFPAGVFALESEIDGQYVIAPLQFAQKLFDYPGQVSWIGVKIDESFDADNVQQQVREAVGEGFKVRNRFEQKESLYTIMKYEKAGIYFVLLLVLVIASFSLIGSLVMLIIEKRDDIGTLRSFGADVDFLRRIFVWEGLLISGVGALVGLLLGVGITLAQQFFGIVKISGDSFLIDSYPVRLSVLDVALVLVTVLIINYLISLIAVRGLLSTKEQKQFLK